MKSPRVSGQNIPNMYNLIATIPTEISTAVTDLEGVWDLLQPVILSVGIFVVLWRFFRKGARKVG